RPSSESNGPPEDPALFQCCATPPGCEGPAAPPVLLDGPPPVFPSVPTLPVNRCNRYFARWVVLRGNDRAEEVPNRRASRLRRSAESGGLGSAPPWGNAPPWDGSGPAPSGTGPLPDRCHI